MQTDPTNFKSVCSLLGIFKEDESSEEDFLYTETLAEQQEKEYERGRGVPIIT